MASVGLAMAIDEFLRLAQGNRPVWASPMLNAPFGLARSDEFVVTSALDALLSGGFAILAGLTLSRSDPITRFGRRWRAYAEEPLAAQLFGVSPRAILAQTFALAGAFAGLSGFVMTMYYGSVGYAAATGLGLKALVAAILGGVGSIRGASSAAFWWRFQAIWRACFSVDYRDASFRPAGDHAVPRPGGLFGVRP